MRARSLVRAAGNAAATIAVLGAIFAALPALTASGPSPDELPPGEYVMGSVVQAPLLPAQQG